MYRLDAIIRVSSPVGVSSFEQETINNDTMNNAEKINLEYFMTVIKIK
jgi:hypothetical protein